MKIKSLRYRAPSGSFMSALLKAVCGGTLSLLFAIAYFVTRLTEGFIGGTASLLLLQLLVLSALLLCLGIRGCIVYSKYSRLAKALMHKPGAVTVQQLSEELVCPPADVFAHVSCTLNNRYWSGYAVEGSTLVLVDGAQNTGTILADPDLAFHEGNRHSRACFGFFVLAWLLFMIYPGINSWQDCAIAGAVSIVALLLSAAHSPKVITVSQHAPKVVAEAVPEKTGMEDADDLLKEGLAHFGQLANLDKAMGNGELAGVVRELLDITRQIFDYVKKHPEKARQVRQFASYYLPTTVKLLRNYQELSCQPAKGGNILESMQKIEGVMGSITSAFSRHLDDLYRDKNIDISADIAVMENMISQGNVLPGKY
jgi:hypothetical protein